MRYLKQIGRFSKRRKVRLFGLKQSASLVKSKEFRQRIAELKELPDQTKIVKQWDFLKK